MLVMKIIAALLYLGGAIVLTYYAVRAYQLNGYFPPKADKTAKVAMLSFFAGSVAVASLSFWTPLASMIASAVLEIATVVIGTVGIVRLRTRLKFTPRATRLFGVAVLVLGGIGGRRFRSAHVRDTIAVLNAMQPEILSLLRFIEVPGLAMYDAYEPLTEYESVSEMRDLIAALELKSTVFRANHASVPFPLEGRFPKDRETMTALLDRVLAGGALDRKGPGRVPLCL